MADDPYTLVHDAIVTLAKTNATLIGLVRARSWVTYNGADRSPRPTETAEADKPEIELRTDGGYCHDQRTSNGAYVTKRWTWWISTGDQRPEKELYPIEWELFRSMCQWKTPLKALSWGGETGFVKDFRIDTVKDTLDAPKHVRSIPGWVGAVSCEADMWFSTSILVPS